MDKSDIVDKIHSLNLGVGVQNALIENLLVLNDTEIALHLDENHPLAAQMLNAWGKISENQ